MYCVMAVMLLQTFLLFQEVVSKSLESCVEFMKVMVPTFLSQHDVCLKCEQCCGILPDRISGDLSGGVAVLNLLMPLSHIYVLLEMFGHFVPEERFSNLTELFSEVINWG